MIRIFTHCESKLINIGENLSQTLYYLMSHENDWNLMRCGKGNA